MTLRMRFVLADSYRGGVRHALLGRTNGPAMCDEPEPPGKWLLQGFKSAVSAPSAIGCDGCRLRAESVVEAANFIVEVDPNDFGPLPSAAHRFPGMSAG